ncbi:MAG: DUF4124 domain-containing protein [Paraglaciecola sp.]|uniref:DUF4124 domain-containing protein n=1 Tax=Paraglaciecola sp. TaxID=1920173 RepID=UPI0032676F0A
MKLLYIISLLLLCITASANVIYKTVKEDGTVVYSDIPTKGAASVNLSGVNSAVIPTLNGSNTKPNVNKPYKKPEKVITYTVSILNPVAEQTIRNNAGELNVKAQVFPETSGQYKLFVDNQLVSTKSSGSFRLESLERGAHEIEVKFLNNSGKILASSDTQTFFLHKASALFTPN